jgi:hypothetical protein
MNPATELAPLGSQGRFVIHVNYDQGERTKLGMKSSFSSVVALLD